MSSIELIRQYQGLSVVETCRRADIAKQSYYNTIASLDNVSTTVLNKLGHVLDVPALKVLHLIDRLYQSNIKITDLHLPETIPPHIRELIYKKHPIFINDKQYKYNGRFINKQ